MQAAVNLKFKLILDYLSVPPVWFHHKGILGILCFRPSKFVQIVKDITIIYFELSQRNTVLKLNVITSIQVNYVNNSLGLFNTSLYVVLW